ncbi:MAG: IS1634 family transposase [Candidatus Dormibacteria bacterium]
MHVASVPSRQGDRQYQAYLLRQSYREGGKVKHRTLANLSMLPLPAIEAIRAVLKGQPVGALDEQVEVERSLPHGHVLAVLGTLRRLGLDRMLSSRPRRERELVLGMVVMRVLKPSSKLATTRNWHASTLAQTLGVEEADEDELYGAMDWLLGRQPEVERQLATRHLSEGQLVLYDLTSTGIEGRHCELARQGYSRDGKRGQLQVEVGLLTDREGCPVAVEVFAGNAGDPSTVETQVEKLRERFGLSEVVLVGDRGMLTSARIERLRSVGGMGWISALRSAQIRQLVQGGELQLGLFDERNLAEIVSPNFPGERLVVCKNGELARERTRKRDELLEATERELSGIQERVAAGRLRGQARIGMRVGRVVNRYKMAKHFILEIADDRFDFQRDQSSIASEARLDGIYVIRASLSGEQMSKEELVRSYKRLAQVERDFRMLKSSGLLLRPVYHRLEPRVRAYVFLCFLAAYLRWHMERAWAPLLFRDEQKPWSEDPVAPARRSSAATGKAQTQRLPDGSAVHSFATLLEQLATLTKNRLRLRNTDASFDKVATPTPLQTRALQLLGLTPGL